MSLDTLKEKAKKLVREDCQKEIYASYPIEKQISSQMGVYGDSVKSTVETFVQSKVDACNTKETAIDACSTVDELKTLWKTYYTKPADIEYDANGLPTSESEDSNYYALGNMD